MDLYGLLTGDDPSAAAQAEALKRALGAKEQFGLMAQLSGDKVLAPVGQALQAQANEGNQRLFDAFRQRNANAQARAKMEEERQQNRAENAFRERELRLRGAQIDQDMFSAVADPVTGGIVMYNRKTGEVRALGPGGGQPGVMPPQQQPASPGAAPLPGLPGKPGEAQRKGVLEKAQSVGQLDMAIDALQKAPGAYGGAGNFVAALGEQAGGTAAQSLLGRRYSPDEQKAKNYISNVVSAIINQRAGANVTYREELRQKFLPQDTDSYEQARQKLLNLRDFEAAAYQVQGNGMVPEPPPAPLAPEDAQAKAWADANPSDPRAAAILERLKAKGGQ